jgi:hypothetical protein
VMALANFWADNTQATLAAEERFADRCFRLRYEDLVTDPEATAAGLFEFLGVPAAPGISERCFSAERERFGPADYKIWYTSQVTADSVGRGWSVPTGMIAPQLLAVINELAGKLGYLAVDGEWGTTEPPADLRVPVRAEAAVDSGSPAAGGEPGPAEAGGDSAPAEATTDPAPGAAAGDSTPDAAGPLRSEWLGEQLRAGLAALPAEGKAGRWEPHASETFVAVAVTKDPRRPAEYWLVDLGAATVAAASRNAQENSDWDMVGSLDVWQKVIGGEVNLSVALRSCELRYCDNGEATPLAADSRIGILASLLGVASWE